MISLDQWIEAIGETDFTFLLSPGYLAAAGLVLGLCLLLLGLRRLPPRLVRAFRGESGYVKISRQALVELVLAACEQLPEVRKPTIRVRAGRRIDFEVRIRLDGTAFLRDTAAYLQSHLKTALENNLGIERLGTITILVTGIKSGRTPVARTPRGTAIPGEPPPATKAGKEVETAVKAPARTKESVAASPESTVAPPVTAVKVPEAGPRDT